MYGFATDLLVWHEPGAQAPQMKASRVSLGGVPRDAGYMGSQALWRRALSRACLEKIVVTLSVAQRQFIEGMVLRVGPSGIDASAPCILVRQERVERAA